MPRTREVQFQQQPDSERDIRFPHLAVEMKWMNQWVQDGIYVAHDDSTKPKFYVLDMFPYPSGVGLHLGHVEGYTASDITARYKRMNGYEVIHPMGWDAFGLPTENYAIKTGIDPHKLTDDNARTFREQCIRTGFSIDWTREVDTSKAEYYKWTQKIFLDLYKEGLAYKAEAPVNWCDDCKTVIANEQVEDGHCERCGSSVEMRKIEQWFFNITSYADQLDEGLNTVDWPQSTKEAQSNWIGRVEGVEIQVKLEMSEDDVTIFTTEPEVFIQPANIIMAPEHPDLDRVVTEDQKIAVSEYLVRTASLKEIERKKQKKKDGVFTGNYAVNPITGDKMPIWVNSSVLMDEYGGIKVEQADKVQKNGILYEDRKAVLKQLGEVAKPAVRYKLRDWLVSRERYWGAPIPIIHCDSCGDQPVPDDQLPVLLPHMDDYTPTGVPPLARSAEFIHTTCPHCGGNAEREAKTLDTFVDSAWYFLRYADACNNAAIANPELLKKWLPVDLYMGGAEFATGHLLYARFITYVLHDLGYLDFTEPFTMLRHQGMVIAEDGRKMSKRWGNVVSPEAVSDQYGSDVLRLYMMFMGPLDQTKTWNTKGISGTRRFIEKVWQAQQKVHEEEVSSEEAKATNALIKSITNAIESGKYNTAVSDFMKYVNFIDQSGRISRGSYETFLKLLAPFAPFIAEELWERSGNAYSIHQSEWPTQVELHQENTVQMNIMLNGKHVGTVSQVDGQELSKEDILIFLSQDENFAGKFSGVIPKKIIYKPGKIFNVITS